MLQTIRSLLLVCVAGCLPVTVTTGCDEVIDNPDQASVRFLHLSPNIGPHGIVIEAETSMSNIIVLFGRTSFREVNAQGPIADPEMTIAYSRLNATTYSSIFYAFQPNGPGGYWLTVEDFGPAEVEKDLSYTWVLTGLGNPLAGQQPTAVYPLTDASDSSAGGMIQVYNVLADAQAVTIEDAATSAIIATRDPEEWDAPAILPASACISAGQWIVRNSATSEELARIPEEELCMPEDRFTSVFIHGLASYDDSETAPLPPNFTSSSQYALAEVSSTWLATPAQ